MDRISVTDFMNREPACASPDATLADLVKQLTEHHVRSMAVIDDSGRLVGVVSETDLFLKEKGIPFSMEKVPTLLGKVVGQDQITQHEEFREVKVREIMSREVVTVAEDASLENVAWAMYRKKVSLLPVVSAGRLVGEVRRVDVLRAIYGGA
jgi:CBS domain-containing protein